MLLRVKKFFKNELGKCPVFQISHIWIGPPDRRIMGSLSIVELPSREKREAVLKKFEGESTLKDSHGEKISVARAKTNWQLKRNNALKQACDVLKKDSRSQNKCVEFCWKMDGTKQRAVKVDNVVCLLQQPEDLIGNFVSPMQDVHF